MYPDETDLAQFLLEAKIISEIPDPIPGSWAMFVSASVIAFEKDTGWEPFLAVPGGSAGNETMRLGIHGNRLYLPTGLTAVDSVIVNSRELELDVDYWLEDNNTAPPWTWIDFRSSYCGNRLIEITGVWGYTETLPDDVRLAILSNAAVHLANSIAGQGGELTRVRQDDVQYDFASSSGGKGQRATWSELYRSVVARYRRVLLV